MNSENTDQIFTALSAAQAEMSNAPLNKVNPHFRSKYADLAAIRDATLPALNKHGLAVYQSTYMTENGNIVLCTRMAHASGQWIESEYPIQFSDKPQIMGSALTYARRYSWAALCGVASEDDDDANAAQDAAKNNGSRLPPKRTMKEISAAKKSREEVHDQFIHELGEANSLVALEKLEAAWSETLKGEGAHIWTMVNRLDDRRRELSAPVKDEEVVDAPPLPPPLTRPEYIQDCHDKIEELPIADLMPWWNGEAAARRRYRLTQTEVDALKARVQDRRLRPMPREQSVLEAG